MKTCLICQNESPDDAATCPNCGEGSWSTKFLRAEVEVPAEIVAEVEQAVAEAKQAAQASAPAPQQQNRKGRR